MSGGVSVGGAEVARSEGLVVLPDNFEKWMENVCVFRGTYSNHLSKVIQHL